MRTQRTLVLMLAATLGLPVSGFDARPVMAEEIIIANPAFDVESVDAKTLGRVFLGKTSRLEGEKVEVVVLQEGSATHANFLTSYVKRNPKQFLSHWRKLCFSGKGILPKAFETEEELVAHVAATPGAIGYISKSTPHEDVKVIRIQ